MFYQSKSGCVNERYLVDITIETELLAYLLFWGRSAFEPEGGISNGGMLVSLDRNLMLLTGLRKIHACMVAMLGRGTRGPCSLT